MPQTEFKPQAILHRAVYWPCHCGDQFGDFVRIDRVLSEEDFNRTMKIAKSFIQAVGGRGPSVSNGLVAFAVDKNPKIRCKSCKRRPPTDFPLGLAWKFVCDGCGRYQYIKRSDKVSDPPGCVIGNYPKAVRCGDCFTLQDVSEILEFGNKYVFNPETENFEQVG